jgi:membrane-anchored mycosin MYCP
VETVFDPDAESIEVSGGGPDQIAAGIVYAATLGAEVICVGASTNTPSPVLHAAVRAAVAAGSVVVAGGSVEGQTDQGTMSYPAGFPEVLAVTATAQDGSVIEAAEKGSHVDLAAPGGEIWSTAAGARGELGHVGPLDEPAAATALVAGVVALVRARYPELDPYQVHYRLRATANHSSAGFLSQPIGAGLVDPVAALTTTLGDTPGRLRFDTGESIAEPFSAAPAVDSHERRVLRGTVVAVLIVILAIAVVIAVAAAVRRKQLTERSPFR